MKVFFGKFAAGNDQFEKQIKEKRYYSLQGSTWFNGISEGDYCFILAGRDVYLWKASKYEQEYLQFEAVISDKLPMDGNKFKAFKYLQFNPQNIVLSTRQVRGKAFFEIQCFGNFTESLLTNIETYKEEDNYRKIYIVDKQYPVNDKDIYLIKENNGYSLYKSPFIEDNTYNSFKDNTVQHGKSGKERSNKDSTIKKVMDATINTLLQDVSLLSFYDLFFSKYQQVESPDDERGVDIQDRPIKGCELMAYPLNQILYGPPGTGKTYNTVKKAVEICDGKVYSNYDEAKERYKELKENGRIDFVTFHQSYGYEEFIEGIRAETKKDKDGKSSISYDVKSGVLKKICALATTKVSKVNSMEVDISNKRVWKMSLGNTLLDEGVDIFQECLDEEYVLLGYGDDIDFSGCKSKQDIKALLEAREDKKIVHNNYALTSVNMFKFSITKGDLVIVSDGNHKFRAIGEVVGDYEFLEDGEFCQMRKVKWLRTYEPSLPIEMLFNKALSQMTLYELKEPTLNKEKLITLLSDDEVVSDASNKPYVLIIDEINRGNMSKIFGELITLIEDDKRLGAEHEMTVRLPVSGGEFGVPSNLHIIGTMNTADRSIAMMDTALRRRFEFEEMMPNPCLLHDNLDELQFTEEEKLKWESIGTWDLNNEDDNEMWDYDWIGDGDSVLQGKVNLRRMLYTINQRIEVLYDREHTIGHAYFMGLNSESSIEDLGRVFANKVIPLLAEYFFEDWEKIRMVLGDDQKGKKQPFILAKKRNDDDLFFGEQPEYAEEQVAYERNPKALSEVESYLGIYTKLEDVKEEG